MVSVFEPGNVSTRPPADANPKDIIGRSKPQLHLIPAGALPEIARVMEWGAAKYGPYNWREKAVTHTTYLSAALRHITDANNGRDFDRETGLYEIAHAAAGLMILLDAILHGTAIDDRMAKGEKLPLPAPRAVP